MKLIERLSHGFTLFKEHGMSSNSNLFRLVKIIEHGTGKDIKKVVVHDSWHATQQLAHATHQIAVLPELRREQRARRFETVEA